LAKLEKFLNIKYPSIYTSGVNRPPWTRSKNNNKRK
jgi:hypothetical protein